MAARLVKRRPTEFGTAPDHGNRESRENRLGMRTLNGAPGGKPLRVAFVVLAVYGAWAGAYLAAGNDVRDFIDIGQKFLTAGNSTAASHGPQIDVRGYDPGSWIGYDGQFSYYLAVTPEHARPFLDDPSYRYGRIGQPLVARSLALGSEDAVPHTLVLVNWLAAGLGTLFLATWLSRRAASPWLALIYGFYPGLLIGLQRDLPEPLAYTLVAWGVVLLDHPARARLIAAGTVFALAGLTRETTLLFPLVLGVWLLVGGEDWRDTSAVPKRRREAVVLLCLSLGPYLAYRVFLSLWLESFSGGGNLSPIPLYGLFHPPWRLEHYAELALVIVPAIVAVIAFLPQGPVRSRAWLPWFLLVANVLVAVVFFAKLYIGTYTSEIRHATGVMLAAVMCVPYLSSPSARRLAWLIGAATVTLLLFPVVAVHGWYWVSD